MKALINVQLQVWEKIAQVTIAFFGTRKRVVSSNRIESIQCQLFYVPLRSFRKSLRAILPQAYSLKMAQQILTKIGYIQHDPNRNSNGLSSLPGIKSLEQSTHSLPLVDLPARGRCPASAHWSQEEIRIPKTGWSTMVVES